MRFAPFLALILASCAAEAQPSKPRPADETRILDGDTLVYRGEVIRIANIDAPELPPHAKCWAEAALSLQAANQLQGIVDMSRGLGVQREGRDRYGRTLARLSYDGRDVGEALIGVGVASRWTGRRWDWCKASPNYDDPAAPDVESYGPEGNAAYSDWTVSRLQRSAKRATP